MRLRVPVHDYLVKTGDLLFFQQGLLHEEIAEDDEPINMLFIGFSSEAPLPPLPLQCPDPDGRIRQLAWWLVRDLRLKRPPVECVSLLATMLSEIQWAQNRPGDPWLSDVLGFLHANHGRSIALTEIAQRGRMSRAAFIRKFKQLTGRTPMEELRLVRLGEARNLILGSDLPLKVIAERVGLNDEFQLSKLFRRYFGASPQQVRTQPPSKRHSRCTGTNVMQ